ncbi:unnamed protein product [Rhodiola kirilowii]
MARRSAGGRSARPTPRAAPARNAPAPVNHAPPPAPTAPQGGGMLSGIGSTIAQGMAFGGEVLWHTGLWTPSWVLEPSNMKTVASEAPAPAATSSSFGGSSDACNIHSKAFNDCVNNFGSDISKCQFYMDMLAECRKNTGSLMLKLDNGWLRSRHRFM